MTLCPAAVLSPAMMKLSGTTMLEETVPGMGWPVVSVWVDGGIVMGRSWATYWTVVVGPFWSDAAEHVEAGALAGVRRVAELVLDAGAELDRVGAAELLLGEADRERGGHRLRDAVDRDRSGGPPA